VLLEAMQQGTPVVATRVGGNAEAVEEGRTGFLVPADAPDALARACLALLEDPALARRMGEAGRARVRERFGLEAQVEAHLACYAELGAKP
jgi:glycosyltransferase involved in cell wall biosynthesis